MWVNIINSVISLLLYVYAALAELLLFFWLLTSFLGSLYRQVACSFSSVLLSSAPLVSALLLLLLLTRASELSRRGSLARNGRRSTERIVLPSPSPYPAPSLTQSSPPFPHAWRGGLWMRGWEARLSEGWNGHGRRRKEKKDSVGREGKKEGVKGWDCRRDEGGTVRHIHTVHLGCTISTRAVRILYWTEKWRYTESWYCITVYEPSREMSVSLQP